VQRASARDRATRSALSENGAAKHSCAHSFEASRLRSRYTSVICLERDRARKLLRETFVVSGPGSVPRSGRTIREKMHFPASGSVRNVAPFRASMKIEDRVPRIEGAQFQTARDKIDLWRIARDTARSTLLASSLDRPLPAIGICCTAVSQLPRDSIFHDAASA